MQTHQERTDRLKKQERLSQVIHYHIFKNAGSTVDAILHQNWDPYFARFEGSYLAEIVNPEELLDFALKNPSLKAISSHNARLPVPASDHISFFPILFLRHPIDRIGSMYAFERVQPPGTSMTSQVAHANNLGGYVRFFLERSTYFLRNFQTVYLSSKRLQPGTEATVEDLRLAIDRLQGLPFFGLVECFDESLLLMQAFLFEEFGRINIAYSVKNKSSGRQATIEERLDEMRQSLGTELYQELCEKNKIDLALYETALNLFKARLASNPVGDQQTLR